MLENQGKIYWLSEFDTDFINPEVRRLDSSEFGTDFMNNLEVAVEGLEPLRKNPESHKIIKFHVLIVLNWYCYHSQAKWCCVKTNFLVREDTR